MEKVTLGPRTFLYPMPVTLVGAEVDGRANFLTIAYCGIVQRQPPMVAVTLNRAHYTNRGIKENGAFSVNIPSAAMVRVTDYCGLVSGSKVDKSGLFGIFHGGLKTAPMIEECPLNLECRLVQTLDYGGSNEIFIGEIVETYAKGECLSQGLPDIRKINPLVFSMPDNSYWRVGDRVGGAWNIGRDFGPKDQVTGTAPDGANAGRSPSPVVELIVIAVLDTNVRCLRLPGRDPVLFRPAKGAPLPAEGEILKVRPAKEWRYNRINCLSGVIEDRYIDGAILTPVPLEIYPRDTWDPMDEDHGFAAYWGVRENKDPPSSLLPEWVRAVLAAGERPVYEMQQVIPGATYEPVEYDPIGEAVDHARAGNYQTAFEVLQNCLQQDLRCIDAYAHLGKYHFDRAGTFTPELRQALQCYRAGVAVGEQALRPGFSGLLPWREIDNRPFLRTLHGLGLCQWRLGRFQEARDTFVRLFLLDPADGLGAGVILPEVVDGRDYLVYAAEEDKRYASD